MKQINLILLIMLLVGFSLKAQTPGELSVSFATSETGGTYAPKNIIAVWIEDDAGNFVKTLLAYAQNRIEHLNTWEASTTAGGSTYNVVDAITGATQTSHDTRTCTWNGTDVSGTLVADGTYNVRMELTDKNSTGNFSTFSFTKGTGSVNLTPANEPSFSSISIDWTATSSSINNADSKEIFKIYPNPSSDVFVIEGESIIKVEVRDISGKLIINNSKSIVNLKNQSKGVYLVKITTDKGIFNRKIVKE